MKQRRKWGWPLALLAEIAIAAAVPCGLLLASLSVDAPLSTAMYGATMWALVPLAGALTAFLAVRKGLHYLLAWIAPALLQILIQRLMTGYLPTSPGMPMVTLLLSVVGAAAGEERNKRQAR